MLLGNGYAALGPVPSTYLGGASGVAYPGNLRTLYGRGERVTQASAFGNLASQPDGTNHPVAWLMPRRAGRVSARSAQAAISATGAGLRGLPGAGAAQIGALTASGALYPLDDTPPARSASALLSLFTNTPAGELIVSGAGSAALSLSALAELLASVQAAGSAALGLSASATPGALADLLASASLALAGSSTAYPLDDASPARSASAALSLSASLVPYAVGHLAGSTVESDTLTPAAIAAAVWAAAAAANDIADSMGEKLNAAGTAGDPWTGLIEGGLTAKEVMRLLLAVSAGRASGGGTDTLRFRDQANTRDRLVVTVDSRGNRSAVTVDAG